MLYITFNYFSYKGSFTNDVNQRGGGGQLPLTVVCWEGPRDYYQDWLEAEEVDELTLHVANNVGSVIHLLKSLQNPYLKADKSIKSGQK